MTLCGENAIKNIPDGSTYYILEQLTHSEHQLNKSTAILA